MSYNKGLYAKIVRAPALIRRGDYREGKRDRVVGNHEEILICHSIIFLFANALQSRQPLAPETIRIDSSPETSLPVFS